ncbi:transposase [Streptomyces sp. NPDC002698]|uniref:IS110 family transposase n=1 Tax=Streptomyces sp. NPDC002698 TaxID=3364660 RepID=UPI00369E9D05
MPPSGKEGSISMTSAAAQETADQDVFGGVDSHADTVHVAVISDNGGHLADAEFATAAAGYAAALAFLNAHSHVIAIGVEGTSSYGAGFTRTAISHGPHVLEVNRPDRAERRRISTVGRRDVVNCSYGEHGLVNDSGRSMASCLRGGTS